MKLRRMYLVRVRSSRGSVASLGSRFVERSRAARIAKWLGKRGYEAHISAEMVNMAGLRSKKGA